MSAPTEARFAEWLKTARATTGMSQQALADALKAQGFTIFRQTTVWKIETCSRPLLLGEAAAIAELFGTTLDVALGLKPGVPQSKADAEALARRTTALQLIQRLVDAELGGAR